MADDLQRQVEEIRVEFKVGNEALDEVFKDPEVTVYCEPMEKLDVLFPIEGDARPDVEVNQQEMSLRKWLNENRIPDRFHSLTLPLPFSASAPMEFGVTEYHHIRHSMTNLMDFVENVPKTFAPAVAQELLDKARPLMADLASIVFPAQQILLQESVTEPSEKATEALVACSDAFEQVVKAFPGSTPTMIVSTDRRKVQFSGHSNKFFFFNGVYYGVPEIDKAIALGYYRLWREAENTFAFLIRNKCLFTVELAPHATQFQIHANTENNLSLMVFVSMSSGDVIMRPENHGACVFSEPFLFGVYRADDQTTTPWKHWFKKISTVAENVARTQRLGGIPVHGDNPAPGINGNRNRGDTDGCLHAFPPAGTNYVLPDNPTRVQVRDLENFLRTVRR